MLSEKNVGTRGVGALKRDIHFVAFEIFIMRMYYALFVKYKIELKNKEGEKNEDSI